MSCQLGFEFSELAPVESKTLPVESKTLPVESKALPVEPKTITMSDKIAKGLLVLFPSATSFSQVYNNQCNHYKLSELFIQVQGHPRWLFSSYSFCSLDNAVRALIKIKVEESSKVFGLVDKVVRTLIELKDSQLPSLLTTYDNRKRTKVFRARFKKINSFRNEDECRSLLTDIKVYIERFHLSSIMPIYDEIAQELES